MHEKPVLCVCVSRDGVAVASGTFDTHLILFCFRGVLICVLLDKGGITGSH
jgi:hypothetical protein